MTDVRKAAEEFSLERGNVQGGTYDRESQESFLAGAAWQKDKDYSILLSMCVREIEGSDCFLVLDDAAHAIRAQGDSDMDGEGDKQDG